MIAVVILVLTAACGGDDTSGEERPNIEDTPTPTEVALDNNDPEPTPTAVEPDVALDRLTYPVESGDTLGTIAARFDVPLGALIVVNAFDDPNLISIGQEIIIPTADEVADFLAAQEGGTTEAPAAEESSDS